MESCSWCGKPAEYSNDEGLWYCGDCVAPRADEVKEEIVAECEDCGKELTRDQVAYHDMEPDTGVYSYYCSDCAPRSYYE